MKVTRQEFIAFIIDEVSEDGMSIAKQLIEEVEQKWFSEGDTADVLMGELYDWLCSVADKFEGGMFITCDKCGLIISENEAEIIQETRKGEGKIASINADTNSFELINPIYETTYWVCPCCDNKILKKEKIINTL